jgi:hypothetical protein
VSSKEAQSQQQKGRGGLPVNNYTLEMSAT